jgi:hypothetical protein
MKWIGSGHFRISNNTVMYSGHNTHRKNGMGMIIANRMSKSLIGYKVVNDRIKYIRVRAHPVNITFMQVYAPTTSADVADIEDFYSDLQATLNETPIKDVLIIMGDRKAKIGKGEEPGTVGRHGLGNRNEAGERLLEFCEENALFLANTYFEHQRGGCIHGHHLMANIKTKSTIYLAEDDGEALFSQWKQDQMPTAGLTTNSSQPR